MSSSSKRFTKVKTSSSKEERRLKRQKEKVNLSAKEEKNEDDRDHDERMAQTFLANNESSLLKWVADVNKIYEDKLKKPAPFMTFVLCGMQSTGKSTIMERFLGAPLNIVQEGTGTRCPLDTTCIHDPEVKDEPVCELSIASKNYHNENLTTDEVFEKVTAHNKELAAKDEFSDESIRLVFKSRTVQNMRFVDTPGIIANRSIGRDNRDAIKGILRSAMKKPNSKLCVLLEPKEFATNSIIDFLDETFEGRQSWISNATFVMTKFDKQFDDSRSGSKANNFFKEFIENQCVPFLVSTPTLAKENLPPEELYPKRKELIETANETERDKFKTWIDGHKKFMQEQDENEEYLNEAIKMRIGFPELVKSMRKVMLTHTARQLPVVLKEIKEELKILKKEEKSLKEKLKFSNADDLKEVVIFFLSEIQKTIHSYLDGSMKASIDYPEWSRTLEEEILEEEESEWCEMELNYHSDQEDRWRDIIADLDYEDFEFIQPDTKFLGGKQIQRAIEFFGFAMIKSLPDPFKLTEHIKNATGYGAGGLHHENWERALVQTVQSTMQEVSNPGINYLIKHIGSIVRGLISLAFKDVKSGRSLSSTFMLVPEATEKFLHKEFETMLWALMQETANKALTSLEPMYSTIDPFLPTFQSLDIDFEDIQSTLMASSPPPSTPHPTRSLLSPPPLDQERHEGVLRSVMSSLKKIVPSFSSGQENFKEWLFQSSQSAMEEKKTFLPDRRSSMMSDEESRIVIEQSYKYICALIRFQHPIFKFQVNHYLINGFKDELLGTFITKLIDKADWKTLVLVDPESASNLAKVQDNIEALSDSMKEVQKMYRGY